MAAKPRSRRAPRPPKGLTFSIVPAPGLTAEDRLERRIRALEVLLPTVLVMPAPETEHHAAGDGAGDFPVRRPT